MNRVGATSLRLVRSSAKRYRGQRSGFSSSASGEARKASTAGATADSADDAAHFGFQQIPSGMKKGMVKSVFSSVAHNYDIMNDLMSAGMHRVWKDEFVSMLGISPGCDAGSPPPKVLDVAGGTGDIAFRMADQLRPYIDGSAGLVGAEGNLEEEANDSVPLLTVSDINQDMLEVGKQRAAERFPTETLDSMRFVQADAEALPFEDDSFHLYTIAFGLRNVTNIDKALREAHRVLKPGGRFMCLEFSHVPIELLQKAYDWYSFNVIPTIGQVVAKDKDAYQYLVESIRMFPVQHELEERMKSAGFGMVAHTNLTAGVVAVHSGFKMPSRRKPLESS
eukprot:jgi/Undpi1/8880/HiC_scaffold_25.g11342.m1